MEKVLSFYLAGELFGININMVKEINRNINYTEVPSAPEHIAGIFNMRGQVVTLLDLGRIIAHTPCHKNRDAACIIIKSITGGQNDMAGFIIDYPGDVLDIPDDVCELPPANYEGIESNYIKKVARLDTGLLIIINVETILRVAQTKTIYHEEGFI